MRLYIIHIEMTDGSRSHYIGISGQQELKKRLQQHKYNKRFPARRELIRTAKSATIHELRTHANLALERVYKTMGETWLRVNACPVCKQLAFPEIGKGADASTDPLPFSAQRNPPKLKAELTHEGS